MGLWRGQFAWAGQGMPRLHLRLPPLAARMVWDILGLIRKNRSLRWLIADNVEGIRYVPNALMPHRACCRWDRWVWVKAPDLFGERVEVANMLCHEAAHARQIKRWNGCNYSGTNRELWERDALEHAIPALAMFGATDRERRWYSGGCLKTRWWE